MCGIVGFATLPGSRPPDPRLLEDMRATLRHRGPDEAATETCGGVGLGIQRLAIVDVAGGKQPYRNETGDVRAVFNGEIYNHRALRDRLASSGHTFRSHADGEVLVHLWEEHGADLLPRLRGMFALAIHDMNRARLFLARDRVGVKPLYYGRTPHGLFWGSELKAVLAAGVARELDLDALGEFLAWEYVPAPHTLLRSIRKLEPGSLLELDLATGDVKERRWYRIPPPGPEDRSRTFEEWAEEVDTAVRGSVAAHLMSDVPLGAFLSGGVDSSLVVAGMEEPRTFSIGFDEDSYNELPWARRVAEALGTRHREEVLRPDALGLFDRLMHFMDDPIADTSIFSTYLVSKVAREEVTVALTGDGGDELFGGYDTYVAQEVSRFWQRVPAFARERLVEPLIRRQRPRPQKKGLVNKAIRFSEGLQHDPVLEHARWRLFMGDALRRELLTPDAEGARQRPIEQHVLDLFDLGERFDPVTRRLFVDVHSYLSDNCLVKVDRMSMAASLEARVPLLDHQVLELAFRMPDHHKVTARRTKPLLKAVAARHVPPGVVYRPKEGFSIPLKHWLRHQLNPLLEETLNPRRIAADGLFTVRTVERLKREHLQGTANHSHLLWSLLVFHDWRERWAV